MYSKYDPRKYNENLDNFLQFIFFLIFQKIFPFFILCIVYSFFRALYQFLNLFFLITGKGSYVAKLGA